MRRYFERAHAAMPSSNSCSASSSIRSAPASASSARSMWSSARDRRQRHIGQRRFSAAYRLARCAAGCGRDLGADEPDKRPEIEGWDAPFDTVSETSPRVKLARRIARTVRQLVDGREPVGIERRAARYGDVLVLVRQRGELFEAIIRALKNEGVDGRRRRPADADRTYRGDGSHRAGRALLLPEDDLALATVLRSPLFGFEDEDLFAVAWDRGRLSLRAALTRKRASARNFPRRPRYSISSQSGAAPNAVCVLCANSRARRAAAAFPGTARPRSE